VAARPSGLRLVLSSRLDPPLALGTLRLAGGLRELRADRLRFSVDEAGVALEQQGLRLSPAQMRGLHACTGGWPTGVRLAGTVLCAGAKPDAFLARFTANDRSVADFLVGEVLDTLPDPDRELLAAAATDGRRADGAEAQEGLERLARTTGLVTPVHEPLHGYRVDALVAAHLRAEGGHPSRSTAALRVRTAGLGQGDPALLLQSVRRFAGTLLVTGQHPVLRDALSRLLPERSAPDDPWLALCSALIDVEAGGDPAGTRADLDRVARLWPADPDCSLQVLRSVTELFAAARAADLTVAPTRPGEECRKHDAPEWTALALVATGGVALLVDADRQAATAALQEALDITRRHGFGYLEMQCCALLAAAEGMAGDYRAMTTHARGTLVTAVAGGWEGSLWSTAGRGMVAYGALLRSEPAEARDVAVDALRQTRRARSPRMEFALRVVHGAALFDGGSRHRGLQEMGQARADLGAVSLAGEQAAALAVLEHRAALALGRPDIARTVADWLSERSGPAGEVLLMRAWTALSTGRDEAARADVRPLLDGSVTGLLPHTIIEALLVETATGVTAGEVYGARRALRAALALSAPLDVIRPFAMAEPPARALLGHHLGRGRTTEPFVARASAAGRGVHWTHTIPLTDAELSMIELLPSSLSMAQIAVELDIAVGEEARGMMHTIYRKLGASSRRTAVAAAFERRLLR
jgi:LuxR family maltose regulon positive regulatory protein